MAGKQTREGGVGATERVYKIEQLLRSRGVVPIRTFLRTLEVSPATFRRDLDILRDRLNAPIFYDRARGGWRLTEGARHELPGLWFSSREIHAFLTFYHFLENLEPGLFAPHIEPLKKRLKALLESKDQTLPDIARRVRVLPLASRRSDPDCFQLVAYALLSHKRLRFLYHGRARDTRGIRDVSPQRLVHYRDNWYLDAWDHGKRALRTFAIDRISEPRLTGKPARDIPEERLDQHYAAGYGIFAGRAKRTAVLRFSPERARWVAEETWHPAQRSRYEGAHFILEVPYANERELVLDILRYGPDVEVLAPRSLRNKVLKRLLEAVSLYRPSGRIVTR